ncbi:hypothetical protein MJO28_001834 [Puccinia striiformis f. sp. tritici]|uniref:Uncharacterized protein n=1 Tax=Puccinia striiformis f. sp. tritici TaxID=168172 RepID=A0ACC0EWT8_9BASI|nr:hypothetical protein MJO28_001834 [Puccinia striiformis f. sp. tritici]
MDRRMKKKKNITGLPLMKIINLEVDLKRIAVFTTITDLVTDHPLPSWEIDKDMIIEIEIKNHIDLKSKENKLEN